MKKGMILLGAPGSGKGTQAVEISRHQRVPHIATGDLFRKHLGEKTHIGTRAAEYISRGELVPDPLVFEMLLERLKGADCAHGILLDGFPRTIAQAEMLAEALPDVRFHVLFLDVPDDEVVRRIAGRAVCSQCQAVYHREFAPPKNQDVCDRCGGQVTQRPDDDEQVVRRRLKVYHEQTAPLLAYYRQKGCLRTIAADRSKEAVEKEISRVLCD